ncbi:hypothetical protein M1B72_05710 [Geomonas paludis]|uniref:Uncharacterized protein n=1 Tax=Geomonas paludis TaxID=2740185 RepID=A0A6V8N311_9BACT|nr:hypothetical protein [Geomonas paludis]UPU37202.1 hypothetical protein M1B72_05710 [Geomonas paludis]GFO66344.1 hypothetical protein GMPD_42630 [Geomonas paludis]
MSQSKKGKESGDLRLGDALVGLPCLQRQRANLAAGMRQEKSSAVRCPVCGLEVPELLHRSQGADDPVVVEQVQERFPGWQPEEGLCRPCLERFGSPAAR